MIIITVVDFAAFHIVLPSPDVAYLTQTVVMKRSLAVSVMKCSLAVSACVYCLGNDPFHLCVVFSCLGDDPCLTCLTCLFRPDFMGVAYMFIWARFEFASK